MDRLEHGRIFSFRIQVCAGREPDSAGDGGPEVGQDISEEVGGDHDLETSGVFYHKHGGGVDQTGPCLHFGIIFPDFGKYLVPEDHGIIEGIGLTDTGKGPALFFCQFIGVADDPLAALP